MTTLWICNPEAALHAQLTADTDRAWREYERDEDLAHEETLAREQADEYGDESDGCPWPDYAEAPCEIAEPEIIDGMPDWPVLAESDEEDEDE